ncbi:MAG TPA: MMPL family transporter [Roseiarcus sp.]|nr:MMPL family transporter [Roseiarcus sp.]
MLTRVVHSIVGFCANHARTVIVLGILATIAAGFYSAGHFRINSDINALLPSNLAWRKSELAFEQAFRRFELVEVVVQAPTPELAGAATTALTQALAKNKTEFESVENIGGEAFFARNGLLFLPVDQLKRNLDGLAEGEPLIQDLASDRSLRGLIAGLEDALLGLNNNRLKLADFARPLNLVSDTLDKVLAGQPASFSWRVLVQGRPAAPNELRGFIEVRPKLNFSAIQPGHEAIEAIHRIVAEVAPKYQASVGLTGPVVMNDEQFGTIKENALRNGLITVAIVVFILWLALRSGRLIIALCLNIVVGLSLTAALGLFMVGAFNLISVYFAVLFVGIGVDFAIQFSVRYRAERHRVKDLKPAILSAGAHVAAPLTLASFATAAGFFSFLPTDYRGVSELGMIAGAGMLIAFATSITFLPALIVLFNPPGEPEPLGYAALAPVDEYLARRRIPIIVGTAIVVVCGLPLLYWLKFDFNPIDLQNPNSEAVATYRELSRDPATGTNAIEALAPSLDQAEALAPRLAKLPEVSRVMTLANFIPADQEQKIPLIQNAAAKLAPAFDSKNAEAPPTDAANIDALNEGADRLNEAAGEQKGPGADAARRLAADLSKLAHGDQALRGNAEQAFIWPLNVALTSLQQALQAQAITRQSLPEGLVQSWITPDGQARISISPKANPNDMRAMRRFADAVLAIAPNATEGVIAILKAGDTIVHAFIEAGIWAFASIAVLLWLVLRRIRDVLLTLIPLALAGVVTLELMVLIGMPFNFANIIALPLLLGVGVAFKIYYIMAWREGTTHLLQTSLTRAVIYSALTTATAFGSLWFSSHPGTSSMGKLLALSLACTLAAAVLFQPILMGKPRERTTSTPLD